MILISGKDSKFMMRPSELGLNGTCYPNLLPASDGLNIGVFAAHDWGYLVLLYLFLQLSRAVVVIVLYPGLRYFGYGLDWKEGAILIWAGLRGAVALSLSLSVAVSRTPIFFIFCKVTNHSHATSN